MGKARITKEQFEIACKIKYHQDLIQTYKKEDALYDIRRLYPTEHERYEKPKKMSVEFCEEELLLLTGNPRGFLE